MSARRDSSRRVTLELLAYHRANAQRLRREAKQQAWHTLGRWLMKLLRRR
jgi:hypothetical protein